MWNSDNRLQSVTGNGMSVAYNGLGLTQQLTSQVANTSVVLVNAVNYDAASRVTSLTFPAGSGLVRTQTYAPFNQADNNGGHLTSLQVGTSNDLAHLFKLAYSYDSFGNIKTLTDTGTPSTFTYDDQNRLTNGYNQPYAYDAAGRLTQYEATNPTVNNTFSVHALKPAGYSYGVRGNVTQRPGGQTLVWDAANHLQSVRLNGVAQESYLYDETGQRLQKASNGVVTTYVNSNYEVTAGVATQYYTFNGQRIAMRKNGVLTYLHADHLGSTQFATSASGTVVGSNQPRYYAYDRERTPSLAALPTDYTFTGQKQDSTAPRGHPIYMNARLSPYSAMTQRTMCRPCLPVHALAWRTQT